MRFMRQRPSGKDQDVPVFEFAMGLKELKLLVSVVVTARKNLPSGSGWKPLGRTLRNMIQIMSKVSSHYKNDTLKELL